MHRNAFFSSKLSFYKNDDLLFHIFPLPYSQHRVYVSSQFLLVSVWPGLCGLSVSLCVAWLVWLVSLPAEHPAASFEHIGEIIPAIKQAMVVILNQ